MTAISPVSAVRIIVTAGKTEPAPFAPSTPSDGAITPVSAAARPVPTLSSLLAPKLLEALFSHAQETEAPSEARHLAEEAESADGDDGDTLELSDEDFDALVRGLQAAGHDLTDPFAIEFKGETWILSIEDQGEG